MNWFKNLNAAPRLLLSFGLLIVLIAAISCLAIINLSQANDRIMALYQKDMAGLGVADELAIARLSLGRVGRDAILNMRDAPVVAADDKEILSALSDLHAAIRAVSRAESFVTRVSLPPYGSRETLVLQDE